MTSPTHILNHVRRVRPTAVLAALALFAALGGTATAATLITGATIKNGSVTGKDLKNSTLTGSKVKNGSLRAASLGASARPSLKGASGEAGPAGPGGSAGGPGVPGPNGVKAPQTATASSNISAGNVDTKIVEKAVPAGGYLVTAKGYLFAPDVSQVTCRLLNGATEADRIEWRVTDVAGRRKPALLAAAVTVTNGPLSVHCQKTGAAAGAFSLVQLIAVPTT